jgi:hypothetical protein
VLGRFPAHLALTDPGKRAGVVVDGVAGLLDVLTRQVGDVRTAHRIGDAATHADLLGLGAVHGLGAAALELTGRRIVALAEAAGAEPIDTAVVAGLANVPDERLDELGDDLAAVLTAATGHRRRLAIDRLVLLGAIMALRVGNGTPGALLRASAAYVGLADDDTVHTEDRWWHFATCHDTVTLTPPSPAPVVEGEPPPPPPPDLTALPDVVALEENPFRTADVDPAPRRHGTRFGLLRGGLEDVLVSVRVVGIGTRTVRPMVVHLDSGKGVVFEGNVPDGAELVFAATGQVTLAGSDVTGLAWGFSGGVFASADEVLLNTDFVFADAADPSAELPEGPTATFAVSTPVADAFGPSPAFPHGAAAVPPLSLPVGESRWVGFVRIARAGNAPAQPAVPRTDAGFFDGSVFADGSDPANPSPSDPSLAIGFAWEEREPFAVRILLPRRFEALDDEAGTRIREPLRLLLDRHRAAGVTVRVAYADPRWLLGSGVVRTETDDPLGVVLAGTELWPDGTTQPGPS